MEVIHGLHGFRQGFVLDYVQAPDRVFVSVPVNDFTSDSAKGSSIWLCYGGRWSWWLLRFIAFHGGIVVRLKVTHHTSLEAVLEWRFEGG